MPNLPPSDGTAYTMPQARERLATGPVGHYGTNKTMLQKGYQLQQQNNNIITRAGPFNLTAYGQ